MVTEIGHIKNTVDDDYDMSKFFYSCSTINRAIVASFDAYHHGSKIDLS